MNFWDKIFLKGIKKFPYGSLEIEWPDGKLQKIDALHKGPNARLKIVDEGPPAITIIFPAQLLKSSKVIEI